MKMNHTEKLREQLYEKASKEQSDFIENLKHQPPEKIIEQAYELVMHEDILMTFEDDYLTDKQIKELLKFDYPLSVCYDRWLKVDCSHMEMLRDTVSDFADSLIKEQDEKEKRHKKDEPER